MPDEVDQRLGEIETAIAAFENRPVRCDPTEIARAGIFVSIDNEGALLIERGFVRPEDEAPVEPVQGGAGDAPETTAAEPVLRKVHDALGIDAAPGGVRKLTV